jgi:hypothetical protein
MNVHVVTGWFGAEEWIESIWLDEPKAQAEASRLWIERRSDKLAADDYRQGVCKFGVEPHPVRE